MDYSTVVIHLARFASAACLAPPGDELPYSWTIYYSCMVYLIMYAQWFDGYRANHLGGQLQMDLRKNVRPILNAAQNYSLTYCTVQYSTVKYTLHISRVFTSHGDSASRLYSTVLRSHLRKVRYPTWFLQHHHGGYRKWSCVHQAVPPYHLGTSNQVMIASKVVQPLMAIDRLQLFESRLHGSGAGSLFVTVELSTRQSLWR